MRMNWNAKNGFARQLIAGAVVACGAVFAVAAVTPASANVGSCNATAGVATVAYGESETASRPDVFVVPFAAGSADLNPVALRVLQAAAGSYPGRGVVRLEISGAEPGATAPETVDMDRVAVTTAYLVIHNVPADAIRYQDGPIALLNCGVRPA